MCSVTIIVFEPNVQVFLQRLDVVVYFLSQRDLIKLIKNGAMEAFTNTIGLWGTRFCLGVSYIVYRQVQLIIMLFGFTAILDAAIWSSLPSG